MDIVEEVSLIDSLAEPTQLRSETPEKKPEANTQQAINTSDFTENVQQILSDPLSNPQSEVAKVEPEPEPPKVSPEESADSIIDIIDLACSSALVPWLGVKLKKQFGKENFEKAEQALVKEILNPEKLTDGEKVLIERYKRMKALMKEMRKEIPFDDEEIRKLKPSTVRLCEKHGIQVNENIAFGANIIKIVSKRIFEIASL